MLEIDSLGKTYGSGEKATEAIRNLSFTVEEKELVCVVGPSGRGKTTLLKCIAGLLPPTRGRAILKGREVTGPPEEMALVFQEYSRSLMPWASVRNNVLLPLRHKSLSRAERTALGEESLEAVGLTRFIDEAVYMADRVIVLTHAPTTVLEILPVAIPFQRDQIETKELPEFAHLRAHVYRLIKRDEATASPEQEAAPIGERFDG